MRSRPLFFIICSNQKLPFRINFINTAINGIFSSSDRETKEEDKSESEKGCISLSTLTYHKRHEV